MKTFNRENMIQYMATLSETKGEYYDSPQDMAVKFVLDFETWLKTKDLPKIALPVRAKGYNVYDANGEKVAGCFDAEMAKAMVVQLNALHVPTNEERIDKEAEKLAGNISAAGKRVLREVRVKNDDGESWEDENPEWPKKAKKTKAKKVTK